LDSNKTKKALITGSSGLVGSWFVKKLLKENFEVTGISLDNTKNYLLDSLEIINDFETHYINIENFEKLEKLLNKEKFDIVYHFAAQTQVRDAINDPITTFNSNIKGTWNLLELCRQLDIPIVVASSDKAYGIAETLPYKEDFRLNGVFPYEVSKSITDMLVNTYKISYGLTVCTLRCGNIYGGGDLNWDRLIPGVIKWLLNNEQPILRTDGSFKRDWVYVQDVVEAYYLVGNKLLSNEDISTAYNFAGVDYLSVLEVYKSLCRVINGEYVEPKYLIDSELEIPDQYLDSSKIENELGFKSRFSLDESIDETVNWYKENLDKLTI
tara:strand:+ start:2864 stop:3838 length:975 start_codon:yes stop_codon:yes gene_type:complete